MGNAMARLGRYFISGQPLHVIQRGNDRKPVFFEAEDYAQYREWLVAAAGDNGLVVHAYVLMTNHVHLLVVPSSAASLPRTTQSLGRRYVRHIRACGVRVETGLSRGVCCRQQRLNCQKLPTMSVLNGGLR
jgi:REP element-mobilizing transposase RayT